MMPASLPVERDELRRAAEAATDTDATVDQIRAFANGLKGDLGPGFGQDVVALCDRHDFWQMSYEEEADLHAESRAEVARLSAALEVTRETAEEAVDRLRRIGDIYSLALCADIEPTEALNRMEVVMRGDPPEGEVRHYVLAAALARIDALKEGSDG